MTTKKEKRHLSTFARQELISGWVFLIPMLIGFLCFTLYPLLSSIYISLCEYNLTSIRFVGLENFEKILRDEWFLQSLVNVLIYGLHVFIGTALSLILSSVLLSIRKGSMAFRMIYYLPTLCGAVAVTFIWQWMYAPAYGILWKTIKGLGIDLPTGFQFLTDDHFMGSMMTMSVWTGVGVSVLMFYATLNNISQSLYDAASIDGAGPFSRFMKITLPAISPVTFYVIITGLIGSLQVFTQFEVMKPQMAIYSMTPVWWIYLQTMSLDYGYASACGMVLGLLIIIITVIQFIVSKYWVSYDY